MLFSLMWLLRGRDPCRNWFCSDMTSIFIVFFEESIGAPVSPVVCTLLFYFAPLGYLPFNVLFHQPSHVLYDGELFSLVETRMTHFQRVARTTPHWFWRVTHLYGFAVFPLSNGPVVGIKESHECLLFLIGFRRRIFMAGRTWNEEVNPRVQFLSLEDSHDRNNRRVPEFSQHFPAAPHHSHTHTGINQVLYV